MLKSIPVSIDRSSGSTPAMELALPWAKRFEAELVGVGFVDQYSIEVASEYLYHEGLIASVHPPLIERVPADYRRVLEQYATRCTDEGVSCTTPEATGLLLEQVLFEAQRHDPIVMVPPHGAGGDRDEVVVAYDGSLQAARALSAAASSAPETDAKVHFVSVATSRAQAARAADQAIPHPIESPEPPASVLLDQVDRLGAGLIAMGAHDEPVLRESFLGSASPATLEESRVPVLLAH